MLDLQKTQKRWSEFFSDNNHFVTAWMFVPREIAEDCERGEIRRSTQPCSMDDDGDGGFTVAYAWMKEAMYRAGLGSARIEGQTPWWCWIQAGNGRSVPSVSNGGHDQILFELRLNVDRLLISDFTAWHTVINYWYLADSEAEDESFEAELKAAGINSVSEKPYPAPLHEKVVKSWDAIFDMDAVGSYWSYPMEDKMLQAVFWDLDPDMIVARVTPRPDEEEQPADAS
jgi:hypothetical protein